MKLLKTTFSSYLTLSMTGLYYDVLLKSKLYGFLYLLFKHRYANHQYPDETYQKYQQLEELIGFLQDHYAETISFSQLANQFGYNNHFMAIFKHHAGNSCMDFLLKLRLNKAFELLEQTTHPISEIAKDVGFSN